MQGLSTGLKNPSGKGKRLIITHIGNENGFLEGGLWVFEGNKSGPEDYHKEMNAENYEEWFRNICQLLPPESVVVIDNATYHSRQVEQLPTSAWRKADLLGWLRDKNIEFESDSTKTELLEVARKHRDSYKSYYIEQIAQTHGITILRQPPNHCDLNPIEKIWAQVKGHVAAHNTTFKLRDVKNLLLEGVANVTPDNWRKCLEHAKKIEEEMWDLDHRVDILVERVVFNVNGEDSDSDTDCSSEDSESD